MTVTTCHFFLGATYIISLSADGMSLLVPSSSECFWSPPPLNVANLSRALFPVCMCLNASSTEGRFWWESADSTRMQGLPGKCTLNKERKSRKDRGRRTTGQFLRSLNWSDVRLMQNNPHLNLQASDWDDERLLSSFISIHLLFAGTFRFPLTFFFHFSSLNSQKNLTNRTIELGVTICLWAHETQVLVRSARSLGFWGRLTTYNDRLWISLYIG